MSDLKERIKQRRTQMLVHSYLYYTLDSAIVDDLKWQQWANELVELQMVLAEMDGHCDIGWYDEPFSDWDASTGYHLPQDRWVREKADYVLRLNEKMKKCST